MKKKLKNAIENFTDFYIKNTAISFGELSNHQKVQVLRKYFEVQK